MRERLLRLDAFLPYRLSYTANLVSDAIARAYDALFGLSIPEWRLIAVVAEAGRLTQAEIGVRTRMDKVMVSRAGRALVERGLLARTEHPDDGRSHLLELTPAGSAIYAAVAPKALGLEQRIFGEFSALDLASLTAILKRIDAATLALVAAEQAECRSSNQD